MGFARHFFPFRSREEVNIAWYPEIEEPIKSREKHYSLVLYILIQDAGSFGSMQQRVKECKIKANALHTLYTQGIRPYILYRVDCTGLIIIVRIVRITQMTKSILSPGTSTSAQPGVWPPILIFSRW